MSSARGLLAKGVPPGAAWLLYLRIAILVLSLIILALAAYAVSLFSVGAGAFLIFVTIKTMLIFGAAVAIEIWAPQYYYRIGALVAYILGVIFWLSGWAWAASSAAFWLSWGLDNYNNHEGGALAACAGLGALTWVLTIVNLGFFIRGCLVDPDGAGAIHQAELGQVKQDPAQAYQPVQLDQSYQYPPQGPPQQQQQQQQQNYVS
ncbi:hypothetical protein VTK73DRAFT_4752 [Phialemonium thermophilum]|uniref:MARVEL domain-containing protein n=1 Tax=Phialemonium thermophilum TaxID=223376 RepID=A0ABR3WSU6_9PEZI